MSSRRIAERRGIIRAGNDAVANSALAKLARRKNQTPADVIVLEALSNVLPDNTYVTELRIEGDKVQVVGITNDAPSLIRLIEQSPHFSRATFFAPTTRSPSDPGRSLSHRSSDQTGILAAVMTADIALQSLSRALPVRGGRRPMPCSSPRFS